jgi:hypothetical protein
LANHQAIIAQRRWIGHVIPNRGVLASIAGLCDAIALVHPVDHCPAVRRRYPGATLMRTPHRTGTYAASCAVLLLGLAINGQARGADAPTVDAPWYEHTLSVAGGAAKAVGSAAGSAWSGISGLFSSSDLYDYLPSQISDDDRRFFATLDALGLQLSEIKVGSGTFAHTTYRFVAAREPSDVDIQRAERKLEDYRNAASGMRSGAKLRIVRSILDVAGDKGFILSAVVIDLWPWPSVDYEISARNRPPEVSERRVMDATQQ